MLTTTLLFAQTPNGPATNATGQALHNLQNSFYLTENTLDAWMSIWDQAIFDSQNSILWIALVTLGFTLAGLSILYVSITQGKEAIEKQNWSEIVKLFIWPLIIVLFLGNNGFLLSESVKFIRIIGLNQVQNVLEIQTVGMTFNHALSHINITNAAREEIEAILYECQRLQNQELIDCLTRNQPLVEAVIQEAEQQNGGILQSLRDLGAAISNIIATPGQAAQDLPGFLFRNAAFPILRAVLAAVQWAFVNILEASLILTATFAPVAIGLSLLPLQTKPIVAWLIGFMSLIGIQLGYNIVIGIASSPNPNSCCQATTCTTSPRCLQPSSTFARHPSQPYR